MITRGKGLNNDRGAAFLLAIYFSALILLLVGGVSLQRTNTEVHASQLSRDVEQAFWRAESALDNGLKQAKTGGFSSPSQTGTLPTGTWKYTVTNIQGTINSLSSQTVTRQITGQGLFASDPAKSVNASVVFTEEGPVHGIWATKTIAVDGGRKYSQVFLTGDLYSQLGSVASTIRLPTAEEMAAGETNIEKLRQDGLIMQTGSDGKVLPADSTLNQKLDAWKAEASADLLSIKNGYMAIMQLPTSAESYNNVTFVTSQQTGQADHVNGLVSVGMPPVTSPYDDEACSTVWQLRDPVVSVDSGFEYKDPVTGAKFRDRSHATDTTTLCLKAIVPSTNQGWLNTMIDQNPPEVIFQKPTTIYITGGVDLSTSDLTFNYPIPTFPYSVLLNTNLLNSVYHIQPSWHVSIGAKFTSAIGANGKPVPVQVIGANPVLKHPEDYVRHGAIWIKPGNTFSGAVYTPDSLVLIRSRDCGATNTCATPLTIQYLVGNEVVVEAESDHAEIGTLGMDGQPLASPTTSVKYWSDR